MTPLAGRRILITRPRAQAADLCARLAALGAEPIVFPTIEITPLEDTALLDRAIDQLSTYHWIIFTSVNGVAAFGDRLTAAGKDAQALNGIRVAAIGPATAKALADRGLQPRFIPDEYIAEAIVEGIGEMSGQHILLPRADIAREMLAIELERRGAVVDEITAYRTLPAAPDPTGLTELRRGVDAITFTSSSTVRNFVALAGRDGHSPHTVVACIGPITANTARELGFRVDVVATQYTTEGLVQALADHFSHAKKLPRKNRWTLAK